MSETLHRPEDVEIVLVADSQKNWHWRIDVDGRTVEDCNGSYSDMGVCLAAARVAYSAYVK